MRIEFKAYGGTGMLAARAWVVLAALNACDKAILDPEQPGGADHAVIYRMDFDDTPPLPGQNNDYRYLADTVHSYRKLHDRNLGFLAPMQLELCDDPNHTLKAVRAKAYPNEGTFSLSSIYLTGQHIPEIKNMLTAAFTSDPTSPDNDKELERSNRDGNYGDLAVNSFINERMIEMQPDNAYSASGIYNALQAEIKDAVVIYAGSMDGGTANTNIDKDIRSLLLHMQKNGIPVDHNRPFRLYALRSTPYSAFRIDNQSASETDIKITKAILDDKFEMASGVIDRIADQNRRARNNADLNNIDEYSYYYLDAATRYWLDGLFLGCSETLDETMDRAKKDGQFHPTHLVELALAQQAMDAVANRLPDENLPHLYAYNDGGSPSTLVTLNSFFGHIKVHYRLKHCTYYASDFNGGEFSLDRYIYAFLLTLVTIKGQMIHDFETCQDGPSKDYIAHLFCTGGAFSVHWSKDVTLIAPYVAAELKTFLADCKFIVDALMNAIEYSQFGLTNPVKLGGYILRHLYDTDFKGKPIPDPKSLSIRSDENGNYEVVEEAADATEFEILDDLHNFQFKASKPKDLKSERFYSNQVSGDENARGRQLANTMIERVFEIYLVTMG